MGKAYTKGQKLAQKRKLREDNPAGIPEIAPIKRRVSQGKRRMQEIESKIPAIQARCRQNGKDHQSDADRRDMKAPWHGCNAGRSMAAQVCENSERTDLWDAIQHIRKTWVQFDAAIGAPRRHAQCLRLLVPLSAFETDAESPAHDDRTDDEKYRQAISAKMQVEGWLGYVDSYAASTCRQVVIDDVPCLDSPALIRALHCVVDGMKGRNIVHRGVDRPR